MRNSKKANHVFILLALTLTIFSFQKNEVKAIEIGSPYIPTVLLTPDGVMTEGKEKILPQFEGGQDALFKYLIANLKSPKDTDGKAMEGKVLVKFVVDQNGEIRDAKIAKGSSEALNEEALRVINQMPNWIPGTIDGKPVSMDMTIPIQYLDK